MSSSFHLGKRLLFFMLAAMALCIVAVERGASQSGPVIPQPKFIHPGIPLTVDDLSNVKVKIQNGVQPWYGGYQQLLSDGHSQLTYQMQGPFQHVARNYNGQGINMNLSQWESDMTAIGNMARLWYYTGNSAYAQKAHDILLTWANTQTLFDGYEANLDMGDYIHHFVTGADILRGTWPGWTQADTTTVQNYFRNVYYTGAGIGIGAVGPANKGIYALLDGIYLALFNDDETTYNAVMHDILQATQSGMQNTLSTGEVGESLRDAGHAYDEWFCLARIAEANWSQGVDIYTMLENRLLATGEYHARLGNFSSSSIYGAQWVPDGATDNYYIGTPGAPYGATWIRMGVNILRGAYNKRLGMPTPWMDLATEWTADDSVSFSFEKVADTSTATPLIYNYPTTTSVSTGLTDAEIGDASSAGGASAYSNGTWTVRGSGSTIFADYNQQQQTHNDNFHFVYFPITGDGTFIAKVDAPPAGGSNNAVAGIAVRDSLNGIPNVGGEIGLSPVQGSGAQGNQVFSQTVMHGWSSMYGGANFQDKYYNNGCISTFCDWLPNYAMTNGYWFKIERLGQWLNLSISPDGTSWATVNAGYFSSFPATMYYGLMVSSGTNGSSITASFSHVAASSGDGNAAVTVPAAPMNIVGGLTGSSAVLRWLSSYGATAYNVKRANSPEGPFTTVGSGVTGTMYTDTGLTETGTYYYAVSASNSAGESANSPADSLSYPGLPPAPELAGMGANNQASLTWTDPIFGVNNPLYFNLKRSLTSGGPYTTVAQIKWTLPSSTRIGNSYSNAPITNGTKYYYVVSTVNTTGEGPNSNEVAVTPYPPLALSVDFQGGNPNTMASAEFAGWIPEKNWNGAAAISGTANNLVTNNGTATAASITWNAPAIGNTSVTDTAGDYRMMKGFLNSGLGNPATIDVTNIPDTIVQAGYDVYVYVDGDNSNNNTTDVSLQGTTQSVTNIGGINYSGNYFQNNFLNAGNFVVFRGLNSSTISLTVQPNSSAIPGRGAPINGIQIVSYASDPLSQPVLPAAPVVTGSPENGAVGLNWAYDSTAAGIYGTTRFNIKRSLTSGGPYTTIGTVNWTTSSGTLGNNYVDTTAVNGTTYYYIVTGTNFNGEGASSNEVAVTPFVRQALSIDFQGGGASNGTPSPMQPLETAGWIPVTNWNNAPGNTGSASNLVLNDGTVTSASADWSANNTWSTSITEAAGDARMMKGYLDTTGTSTTTVHINNLPANFVGAGYDVYVYFDGDNGSNAKNEIYTLAGTTLTGVDLANVNFYGEYYQNNNGGSNYVVFRNVTTTSFTLTATPLSSDGAGGRAPINGISLVSYAVGAVVTVTPPAAPVVTATPENNAVGLTWPYSPANQGFSNPTVFNVKRSLSSGGPYTTIGTVTWTLPSGNLGNSYRDTTAVNGTTYYYIVTGQNSAGEGSLSNEAAVTPFYRQAMSIDFRGGSSSNGTPSPMQPTEVAGWIPLASWNNAPGNTGTAGYLALDDGTVTGASINWSSNNTWSIPITEAAGDARMMKGYLDTNGAGKTGATTSVVVNGLPFSFGNGGYDVYVYTDGDNGSNSKTGQYTLAGSTLSTLDLGNLKFSGQYFQNNGNGGNFVVFRNVKTSSFTLTATPLASDGAGGRAPINGISIVSNISSGLSLQADTTLLTYPGSTNLVVSVPNGNSGVATGSVDLYDGTVSLGSYLLQGDGKAYIYLSPSLTTGVHFLQTIYAGDTTHAPQASDLLQITVNPASSALSVSCWNSSFSYGGNYNCTANLSSAAGTPTGNLNYILDGGAGSTLPLSNGNASLTVFNPNAGAHSIVFSYPAQGNWASSTTVNSSFTVTSASTQIQLTPSSYYQSVSTPLTLTASLSSWSAGSPGAGTVSFYDGSALMGTASAGAQVNFTVPSPTVGTHSYAATYTPDASGNYAAATSGSVNVQITQ